MCDGYRCSIPSMVPESAASWAKLSTFSHRASRYGASCRRATSTSRSLVGALRINLKRWSIRTIGSSSPPSPTPQSIRDFYAFEQHVRTARERRGLEMDPDWYQIPVFYFTNPHAVIGPDTEVAIPPGCMELDFELEVAAVVGRGGSDFSVAEAEAAIAGYMIMNDWSARDLQRREMRQGLGPAKGKDFATSLGPWLVTPDELAEVRSGKAFELQMTATVNGREYSRASLATLHWSFGEMLAYASSGARVEAGDIIGSGTCGTGCILELSLVHGSEAYPWL